MPETRTTHDRLQELDQLLKLLREHGLTAERISFRGVELCGVKQITIEAEPEDDERELRDPETEIEQLAFGRAGRP